MSLLITPVKQIGSDVNGVFIRGLPVYQERVGPNKTFLSGIGMNFKNYMFRCIMVTELISPTDLKESANFRGTRVNCSHW